MIRLGRAVFGARRDTDDEPLALLLASRFDAADDATALDEDEAAANALALAGGAGRISAAMAHMSSSSSCSSSDSPSDSPSTSYDDPRATGGRALSAVLALSAFVGCSFCFC